MLRITENVEDGRIVRLRLDGSVAAESAEALWELCSSHQSTSRRTLLIDMAGVNFMSPEAARKLARLRSDSLRVINCSPFIATLLDTTTDSD
jgi:anti-anti-sigma regulatory factor